MMKNGLGIANTGREGPPRRNKRMSGGRLALAAVLTLAAATVAAAFAPPAASAGTFQVSQCSAERGTGRADMSFSRNSARYHAGADCGSGGSGLLIRHEGGRESKGSRASWRFQLAPGLELLRIRLRARGVSTRGHKPEIRVVGIDGKERRVGYPRDSFDSFAWNGGARELTALVACIRDGGCPAGDNRPLLRIRALLATVRDSTPPQITDPATAADGKTKAARRATVEVTATATDTGGGIREVTLLVNDRLAFTDTVACDTAAGNAARQVPCPLRRTTTRALDTRQWPWQQGVNRLTVCAHDYATSGSPNRACRNSNLRVDNRCPVSGEGGNTSVSMRLTGNRKMRRDGRLRVQGTLRKTGGGQLAGATVCVATQVEGRGEKVVATPKTDADGNFRVTLPRGPGRTVRVAHWSDSDTVAEARKRFRVKARPALRVTPRRTIRNGSAAFFRGRLRGPDSARRQMVLEVRSGGRWRPVKTGRTNGRGVWRTAYRFRATTRPATYRFRIRVPRQNGYGYAPGASRKVGVRVKP